MLGAETPHACMNDDGDYFVLSNKTYIPAEPQLLISPENKFETSADYHDLE